MLLHRSNRAPYVQRSAGPLPTPRGAHDMCITTLTTSPTSPANLTGYLPIALLLRLI